MSNDGNSCYEGLRRRTRLPVGLAEDLAVLWGQMEETWVGTTA